jgi:hypothetical protein
MGSSCVKTRSRLTAASVFLLPALLGCSNATSAAGASNEDEQTATTQEALQVDVGPRSVSYDFAHLTYLPAGIAAGETVYFVGDPLDGRVFAYSRLTGRQVGELPQPPGGFSVPFIMHQLADGRVGVLAAGGVPQIKPLVLANPVIYEYTYGTNPIQGFSATLDQTISFSSVPVGFPEDFAQLDDGRILLTDSVLGSIWIAGTDGTITPGIVPKTFNPEDAIPTMVICPTMPEVTVNGVPFLFTGSTIPGIEPITVRNGTVYFHSSCARGIYEFPVAILSDHRQPYQRAADIRLLAATPANIQVEELLEMQFNPYDPHDTFMYAAHGMQLEVIRVDSRTGARQTVAHDPTLYDFPSSIAFLPPIGGIEGLGTSMFVLSNQQERTPITNDAVTEDSFHLPFIVAKLFVTQ